VAKTAAGEPASKEARAKRAAKNGRGGKPAAAEQLSQETLLDFYHQMVLIRRFEETAAEMYTRRKIGGFLHLYVGEEAVAVGAIASLRPDDYIVSHYRDHGHALARGTEPKRVMAELFGRQTGVSHGKGGSMHLYDKPRGFLGGYAIRSVSRCACASSATARPVKGSFTSR